MGTRRHDKERAAGRGWTLEEYDRRVDALQARHKLDDGAAVAALALVLDLADALGRSADDVLGVLLAPADAGPETDPKKAGAKK